MSDNRLPPMAVSLTCQRLPRWSWFLQKLAAVAEHFTRLAYFSRVSNVKTAQDD
jgi:hypothetical protein